MRFNGDGFSARLERRAREKELNIQFPQRQNRGREASRTNNYLICTRIASYTAIWRVHYLLAKLAHRRGNPIT